MIEASVMELFTKVICETLTKVRLRAEASTDFFDRKKIRWTLAFKD